MQSAREQSVAYFKAGEFEKAIAVLEGGEMLLTESDITSILVHFRIQLEHALRTADFQAARRLRIRLDRFSAYGNSGFATGSLIKLAEIPEGYSGKILLLLVSGGLFDRITCLRSNDLYHREILRNTELELQDLGLTDTRAYELGGAYLTSEPDGSMRIWGSSDEFGACDRDLAAKLVRSLFPERMVVAEA